MLERIEKEFNKFLEVAKKANKKILDLNIKEIKEGLTKREMYDRAIALMNRAHAEFQMEMLLKDLQNTKKLLRHKFWQPLNS